MWLIIKSPRRVMWLLLAVATLVAVGFFIWGDRILIFSEPLPKHADAAVVLQGSIIAEDARVGGALSLLRQGIVDRVLLGVPKQSYWGQAIAPIARTYLEKNYGDDLAARVDFCETGNEVDSTWQEAQTLSGCIREHDWQSIVLVTSDYHTRRAHMVWMKTMHNNSNPRMWVEGVADPEFQHPWWRHRRSAKIWFFETTKLIWTILGER
jgi:uncharacterized SAM-binding protein YcdF (DUF218 family)